MKVVAVSGGSKGLGAAIVQSFLDDGYRVASFSRRRTQQVDSWTEQFPDHFYFQEMDQTSPAACKQFVASVEEVFGAIQILINNAGVASTSLLALADDESIDSVVDLNLKGTFSLTRQVTRSMLSLGWGRIINISSIIGLSGYRGLSVYGATKAGLDGFSRAMARELGARNITVNSVAPGYLTTEMTEELDSAQSRQIIKRTPLGRLGDPDDVTGLIMFLCSEKADFITGQVMVVDGGINC
ncbi:MAG: 3-oxoacyl-ACP reductase FabG [Halieaceae bacterium]